jgi:cobalt-zinc-cadmium efflux system protein
MSQHAPEHHHHGPTPKRALWIAVLLNAAFLALEASVGWWTGSLALLSDAGHMVTDVSALLIALVAVHFSERTPSANYTFGLRRAPVLGGLLNAVSLIVIVVLIGVEAVERFQRPPLELAAVPVFWTGLAGLGVNLGSAWYLARSRDESVNTRGAITHLLSDALGSVAAIVSAIAIGVFNAPLADPIASVVIAALILVGSWPLVRDTVHILLQRAPANIDVASARALVLAHPDVVSIEDFHLWGLDAGQPVLTALLRVRVEQLDAVNALTDALRDQLRARCKIEHCTLECRHLSSERVPDRY